MKDIPFRHPDDTHDGAAKGAATQLYFQSIFNKKHLTEPRFWAEKVDRNGDLEGKDFLIHNGNSQLLVAVSSFWAEQGRHHRRITIGSIGNN